MFGRLLKVLMLAAAVCSSVACQRGLGEVSGPGSNVEKFAHDARSCPQLPNGVYHIAGIPESQRTSITVSFDNTFSNSVLLGLEGRIVKTRPTGQLQCQDFGVETEDRVCFQAGCRNDTYVISYSGVAGRKPVKGLTVIRPLTTNTIEVSETEANQGPVTREYRRTLRL